MSQNDFERYLYFRIGAEHYAIPLLTVKEVVAPSEITPVPKTPSYFLGIVNLRGQIVSVMDLGKKLGLQGSASPETAIIICDLRPNSIGILVDSIESVVSMPREQALEKPDLQGSPNSEFVQGVVRQGDKLVLLLDIVKTLGAGDYLAIAKAQPARAA